MRVIASTMPVGFSPLDDPQLNFTSQIVLVHLSMFRLRGRYRMVKIFAYHLFGVFMRAVQVNSPV